MVLLSTIAWSFCVTSCLVGQKRDQMQTRRALVSLRAFRSFDVRSAPLQLRPWPLRLRDWGLAGKPAADIGCRSPIHQATILQERHGRGLCVR